MKFLDRFVRLTHFVLKIAKRWENKGENHWYDFGYELVALGEKYF